MKYFFISLFILLMTKGTAQRDISVLSDEFNDSISLKNWSFFHSTEGYPDKIKKLQVNVAGNSLLQLQPGASGWYADYQAPFLFKTVAGNFDLRAKLKVSGI